MRYDERFLLNIVKENIRAEIGQVCVQWGFLETMIESTIWQAANVQNDIGRTLTSQLQMQSKIDLLLALLNQNHPELAPHFDRVARYIRECLIGRRNLIIHGMWGQEFKWDDKSQDDLPAFIVKFSSQGRLTDKSKKFSAAELKELATNIGEVSVWVMDLSKMLPTLIQRLGGLGHHTADPENAPDCANRKALALQPLPSQE